MPLTERVDRTRGRNNFRSPTSGSSAGSGEDISPSVTRLAVTATLLDVDRPVSPTTTG